MYVRHKIVSKKIDTKISFVKVQIIEHVQVHIRVYSLIKFMDGTIEVQFRIHEFIYTRINMFAVEDVALTTYLTLLS